MSVLLVSANPLFREILAATLHHADLGIVQVEPAQVVDCIQRETPDVLLLDSGLLPADLAHWLYLVRTLHCGHVILVDPTCNEMTLLDMRTTEVVDIADLVNAVQAGIVESRGA